MKRNEDIFKSPSFYPMVIVINDDDHENWKIWVDTYDDLLSVATSETEIAIKQVNVKHSATMVG